MVKWVRVQKSSLGMSAAIEVFDKIAFYAGKTDHWGLGFDINFYDRSFTIEVLNWYFGFEIYYKFTND